MLNKGKKVLKIPDALKPAKQKQTLNQMLKGLNLNKPNLTIKIPGNNNNQ